MSLIMAGHIDAVFQSGAPVVVRYRAGGSYNDLGIWQPGPLETESYVATIQPLNDRELDNLLRAGQRIIDGRKVYINSGDLSKLTLSQELEFIGQRWKIIKSDIRPWRVYAKIVVSRFDDQ